MDRPNAVIATSSFDRTSGTFVNPTYQPYNNFRIQNQGGNIVQGQLNKLSVTEVMFPYCTPTIVENSNDYIHIKVHDISGDGTMSAASNGYSFQVEALWYTGADLVTELNGLSTIITPTQPISKPMSDFLLFSWNSTTNEIYCESNTVWSSGAQAGQTVEIVLGGESPAVPSQTEQERNNPFNYPNFWWVAGFRNFFATNPTILYPQSGTPLPLNANFISQNTPPAYVPSNGYLTVYGAFYTGRYTDYVDIVSNSLCQAQYLRDSTTSQNTTRRDIITRVYICNNIAVTVTNPEGTRPFIVHRLYPAPKVMKWTADRSIDAIDLALYDMWGQPLPTAQSNLLGHPNGDKIATSGEADYAITIHVHEPRDDVQSENIGYSYRA